MGSFVVFVFVCLAAGLLRFYGYKDRRHRAYTATCLPPAISKTDIAFYGRDSGITVAEIHRILVRRHYYYMVLDIKLQKRFLSRVHSFMQDKLFIIKDDEGFKEMPVLVSASAVQLTFGLRQYRLPFYQYIRIYPEEFIGENSFSVLAGRVQGNVITIAWNQLLTGNADPKDGSNVGLHKMSHALYVQKIVIEEGYAKGFHQSFSKLLSHCKRAFVIEANGETDLYTSYANTNLQEFWAESVELFFEKPEALHHHYPDVYRAMKLLLNQNPANHSYPLLSRSRPSSFSKRFRMARMIIRRRFRWNKQLNETP